MSIQTTVGDLHSLFTQAKLEQSPRARLLNDSLGRVQACDFNYLGQGRRPGRGGLEGGKPNPRKMHFHPSNSLPILPDLAHNSGEGCYHLTRKPEVYDKAEFFDNVVRIFRDVTNLVVNLINQLRNHHHYGDKFSKDPSRAGDMQTVITDDGYTLGFRDTDTANEYVVSKTISQQSLQSPLSFHISIPVSGTIDEAICTLTKQHIPNGLKRQATQSTISLHDSSNPSLRLCHQSEDQSVKETIKYRPESLPARRAA